LRDVAIITVVIRLHHSGLEPLFSIRGPGLRDRSQHQNGNKQHQDANEFHPQVFSVNRNFQFGLPGPIQYKPNRHPSLLGVAVFPPGAVFAPQGGVVARFKKIESLVTLISRAIASVYPVATAWRRWNRVKTKYPRPKAVNPLISLNLTAEQRSPRQSKQHL
jgi:hypothetical protein